MREDGATTPTVSHPFPSGPVNEMAHARSADGELTVQSTNFQRAEVPNTATKQMTAFACSYQLRAQPQVTDGLSYNQYLDIHGGELHHYLFCATKRVRCSF